MLFTKDITKTYKVLIICFLHIYQFLYTQSFPPIQSYPLDEYEAGNQNWMITQSDIGEIYIANNQGILSFDSERWKLYPTNSIVRSVAYLNNVLYSGSYMDFGYWNKDLNGNLIFNSLVQEHNLNILEDEQFWNIYKIDDLVIFQSLNRLFLYDFSKDKFSVIQPEKSILKSFVVDKILYLQLEDFGLYSLQTDRINYLFGRSEFNDTEIIELFSLTDGLRILTSTKGFFTHRKGRLKKWEIQKSIFSKDLVYSALQSLNGDYVIGTVTNGLYILSENGKEIKNFNYEKGLLNNTILSVFEDKHNNLWLGLDNGLNCILIDSPFKLFTDPKRKLGTVYDSKRYGDKIYIATNKGLFYRPADKFDSEHISVSGLSGQAWNIEIVNDLMLVGHDRGSFIIKDDVAIRIGPYIGAWTHKAIDRNTILVGTYDGVHLLKRINGVWNYSSKINGFDISSRYLEIINPYEILISHEYKGVFKLKLSNDLTNFEYFKILSVKRGRHASLAKLNNSIYYLSPDGMFEFNSNVEEFLPTPLSTELFNNDSYLSGKMNLDKQNRIWIFFEKNIVLLEKNIFDFSFSVQKIPIHSDLRSSNLGFENVGDLNDGSYMVGTMNGFLTLTLTDYVIPDSNLYLSHITTFDPDQQIGLLPINPSERLSTTSNNIRFDFFVPLFNELQSIQYKWFLEGYHADWTSLSDQPYAEFNNLDYGNYIFHLKSQSGEQQLGETLSYAFSIPYPWYMSNMAIISYIIIFISLSYFINTLYTNYYTNKQLRFVHEFKKEQTLKELTNSKLLIEEKNNRLKQSIENKNRELAISTMSMIKKNTLLLSIKESLTTIDSVSQVDNVISNINKNINNQDDWSFFEKAFNNADQDFLKKVKEIHPNLTPNDLRLCAYLRLNLSSKEIAPLLNISPKSVEIKRYRLRKRMNLTHDTNLVGYILSV